jgi:transposase
MNGTPSVASRLVAARLPGAEKPRRHRFEGGDTAALLRLIAELRSQALTRRGGKTDVACCFEAGRDGFWLHRLLTGHGVSTYMLEPTGILMNRRAKRVPKRIGSTQRICFACVPSGLLAIGRYVAWCVRRRMRKKAPSARTASANSLYMTNSASKTELRRCCSRRASGEGHLCASGSDVAALRTGDRHALLPLLRAELERLRRRLILVLELIREPEQDQAEELEEPKVVDRMIGKIIVLQRIRDIGENFPSCWDSRCAAAPVFWTVG